MKTISFSICNSLLFLIVSKFATWTCFPTNVCQTTPPILSFLFIFFFVSRLLLRYYYQSLVFDILFNVMVVNYFCGLFHMVVCVLVCSLHMHLVCVSKGVFGTEFGTVMEVSGLQLQKTIENLMQYLMTIFPLVAAAILCCHFLIFFIQIYVCYIVQQLVCYLRLCALNHFVYLLRLVSFLWVQSVWFARKVSAIDFCTHKSAQQISNWSAPYLMW